MSSTTVIQQILGDLLHDEKVVYQGVRLTLVVNEIGVDEETRPVRRVIEKMTLSPMSGMVINDGNYILRYAFDGQTKEDTVRIERGYLLAV